MTSSAVRGVAALGLAALAFAATLGVAGRLARPPSRCPGIFVDLGPGARGVPPSGPLPRR